jgi:hypothetical protein
LKVINEVNEDEKKGTFDTKSIVLNLSETRSKKDDIRSVISKGIRS